MTGFKPAHPSDELVDNYSMGKLTGSSLQAFEEHIFVCFGCRKRVAETDVFLTLLRKAFDDLGARKGTMRSSGPTLGRADRRKEVREACSRLVAIRMAEESKPVKSVTGLLIDRTPSGAGIYSNAQVRKGSRVVLRTSAGRDFGVVKYCVKHSAGFNLGVEFLTDASQDS